MMLINDHYQNYKAHVEIAKRMDAAERLPATFMAVDPVSKSQLFGIIKTQK